MFLYKILIKQKSNFLNQCHYVTKRQSCSLNQVLLKRLKMLLKQRHKEIQEARQAAITEKMSPGSIKKRSHILGTVWVWAKCQVFTQSLKTWLLQGIVHVHAQLNFRRHVLDQNPADSYTDVRRCTCTYPHSPEKMRMVIMFCWDIRTLLTIWQRSLCHHTPLSLQLGETAGTQRWDINPCR